MRDQKLWQQHRTKNQKKKTQNQKTSQKNLTKLKPKIRTNYQSPYLRQRFKYNQIKKGKDSTAEDLKTVNK